MRILNDMGKAYILYSYRIGEFVIYTTSKSLLDELIDEYTKEIEAKEYDRTQTD
ncbi:MAG: hypothetical protein QXW39_09855 [Candidatus Bathyarchaeia archaeon]